MGQSTIVCRTRLLPQIKGTLVPFEQGTYGSPQQPSLVIHTFLFFRYFCKKNSNYWFPFFASVCSISVFVFVLVFAQFLFWFLHRFCFLFFHTTRMSFLSQMGVDKRRVQGQGNVGSHLGALPRTIITSIESRQVFLRLLQHNPGMILIKLGAPWCKPCLKINPLVHDFYLSLPSSTTLCVDLNVDECADVYSLLKAKRMVNGIPTLLCYYQGNATIYPDDSISGMDIHQVRLFFERCRNYLST